uniref:doublesex- and mab-3-related transcription factor 1A-like n=1 Tax=Scatophagus argus TaxID=75038 RepID=UPI001ED84D5C|nr:doublesex- and mab-3-related transcription factor 1A-like [Scatophagus argus]
MSSSKATEKQRESKCVRCRHHGLIIGLKGHKNSCPFQECNCPQCSFAAQRLRSRSLKRKPKTHSVDTGVGAVKQANGGTRQSATSGLTCGNSERDTLTIARWHPDLRPAAGGGDSSGGSLNAPHFSGFGQAAPLPVVPFPFRMSGPSSCTLGPNLLVNILWLPPVPAGVYNNSVFGPSVFSHLQPELQSGQLPNPRAPAGGADAMAEVVVELD